MNGKALFARAGLTFLLAIITVPARAQGTLNASFSVVGAPSGGSYNYTLTLANNSSSTDPINTLWMSWIPGYDFLPSQPTGITTPIGWNAYVEGGGYGYYGPDGYSIEFTTQNSSYGIAPGGSVNFGFTSPDAPSALNSSSPYFPYYTVLWSYVYSGSAAGPGYEPTSGSSPVTGIAAAPEPANWAIVALGAGVLLMVRRRKPMRPTAAACQH